MYGIRIYMCLAPNVEKAMATHSSTLAWKIPWTEGPGRLQSMGSLGVGHDWATSLFTFHFHALEKEMATHSSVLAWRIPGTGESGGLLSVELHRVGHDWRDTAAAAPNEHYHLSFMCQKPLIQRSCHLFKTIKTETLNLIRTIRNH